MKTQTHDIPALALRAMLQPRTVDAEKRTVEVIWTTGARVLRGYYDRFYEELSLDPKHVRLGRLNNGAPFLPDHDSYSVSRTLGVVENARLEGKRGVATIRFAKAEDDPEADKVFRKIQDGIIQNVSVGYRIHKLEKVEDGDGKIPVYRATDWEPFEISAVAVGGDDGAGFRSAEAETNSCEFVVTRGMPPHEESRAMDETEKRAAEQKAAEEKRQAELKATAERAAREERERAAGIRLSVRAAKFDDGEAFAEKLINEGTPVDKARELVLERLAKQSDAVRTDQHTSPVEVTEDARDKFVRGATAWLIEKSGMGDVIERATKAGAFRDAVALDPGEFRGMSMMDLARESLERRGVRTRGMDRMQIAKLALTHRADGMASTSDFVILFETAMHKTLLGAYATTPDTWSRFCKVDTVPDFRESNRYRVGSFSELDSLNEGGEYKNKAIPDGDKLAISVGTKGNIIALTRQAIINDDMSALSDLSTRLGRAARLSIEKDVYALVGLNSGLGPTQADGQPFFHANRSNVGSGAAIGTDALDADRVVLAQQKDSSGNEYLDLKPAVLLVPIGLGGQARILNQAQYDTTVSSKFQVPNKVVGLFRDIVDTPRLSGTRRYLFADPSVAPAIVVAFLEGSGQAPVLESQEGWRTDGVEWKVRLDYKAQAFDPKGAVTNAGV